MTPNGVKKGEDSTVNKFAPILEGKSNANTTDAYFILWM